MNETSAVGTGTKVLVAHGSTRALKKAVQELQLAGCEVLATPDGGDAFARFFEDAPAAVVCSANLPSLSGINFARMVRSQSPETQVVILAKESIYDVPPGAFVLGEPLHIEELRRILPGLFPGHGGPTGPGDLQTPVFVQAVLRRFERDSDMLKAFDDDGIRDLSDIAQAMPFEDGERIIAQGELGDGFYLVVEGQVRVTLAERDDAQIARIGPGGFFGEMSMLSEQPRSASVWSVGRSTLLYFAKEDVSPLLDRYPRVREVLSGVALKRTEDNLWSVLFEESEVDETLADLESSLTRSARPPEERDEPIAQAPTTARVVERGEALPQNDYGALPSAGVRPAAPAPPSAPEPPPSGDAIAALAAYGAVDGETPGMPAPPSPGAAPAPEPRSEEDVEPEPVIEGYAIAEGTEDDVAAVSSVEISQETHTLPPAPARRSVLPAFFGGTVVGLAAGVALALSVFAPSPSDHAPRTPVAQRLGEPLPAPTPGSPLGDDTKSSDADAPVAGGTEAPEPTEDGGDNDGGGPPETAVPEPSPDETKSRAEAQTPSAEQAANETTEEESAEGDGTIPSFSAEQRELDPARDEERKVYRKRLFAAVKRKAWPLAVRLGKKLRDEYRLDWEAQLQLAEALRMSGEQPEAIAAYRHFVSTYPTNVYADTARYWLGELFLERGQTERAERLFDRAAAGSEPEIAERAKQRLAEFE